MDELLRPIDVSEELKKLREPGKEYLHGAVITPRGIVKYGSCKVAVIKRAFHLEGSFYT